MEWWRERLTELLLLVTLSAVAGFGMMALHGAQLYRRLRCRGLQSWADCVPPHVLWALVVSVGVSALLAGQLPALPLAWLGDTLLLAVTGPVLLAWLGPPREHVESSRLCQIGRGSAYSHYYGYLRLMQGQNGVRKRLGKWKKEQLKALEEPTRENQVSTMPADAVRRFYTKAVFVLAPADGEYPDTGLSQLTEDDLEVELPGIGPRLAHMPEFKSDVGGNTRSYGKFTIHEIRASDHTREPGYVALDTISALGTLRKLKDRKQAGLSEEDFKRQLQDMMNELTKIVREQAHLRGQIQIVTYQRGEHVGDKIMKLLDTPSGDQASSCWGDTSMSSYGYDSRSP